MPFLDKTNTAIKRFLIIYSILQYLLPVRLNLQQTSELNKEISEKYRTGFPHEKKLEVNLDT
jgi:hypothetical protein